MANKKDIKKHELDAIIRAIGPVKKPRSETVRLIDGATAKKTNVIGYCNLTAHRGWLSKTLYDKHHCAEKKCPFFQKSNRDYWIQIMLEQAASRKNREHLWREEKQRRDEDIRATIEAHQDVYVTKIREIPRGLQVSYIYSRKVDLSEAIKVLKAKYYLTIFLKPVRAPAANRDALIINRRRTDLLAIPGVGKVTAERLIALGYGCVEDLAGKSPELMHAADCRMRGVERNGRLLRAFRIAVEYANKIVAQPV